MTVATMFERLCSNLVLGTTLRASIATRVGRMVRCLNEDFRSTSSDAENRFYVGSYGRNTAIPSVSDVDAIFVLTAATYHQYDKHLGNGQSALLQAMRTSVRRTYPTSEVAADGQVIVVSFTDGVKVEILGGVVNQSGGYNFPDSNGGGSWRSCKPKQEMAEFSARDKACNYNLVQLGRMVRAWRDQNDVSMSGMLIDTLAYQFIGSWPYRTKSYLYYDWMTRDFFAYLASLSPSQEYWLAPGSGSYVRKTGSFQAKARSAHALAVSAINHLSKNELWSAHFDYRSIYGNAFPAFAL